MIEGVVDNAHARGQFHIASAFRRMTRHRITVGPLIFIALLAAAPLWGPGMVNTRGGGDSPFLLQRTHQLVVNLRAGVFPVRWMPDAAYGLGYPFFNYYAALPYYLAALLVLLGVDILTALKLVQTLGFVAAALAMYGWMCDLTRSHRAAWLAAVAYTVAPFHLVNVYVRGDSLSEFYAFVFYPLILWGLDKASNPKRLWPPRLAWPALAYAGLIITHNISAFIFSPFILLYLVFLALRERDWGRRVLASGIPALGLGLLLSAWVWTPALAEKGIVQTGTLTKGYFHYTHHFRTTDLIQHHLLFNYSIAPDGESPFAMGLAQAVFTAMGGLALVTRGLRRRLPARWGFVLLGLLISTAMITPLSKFLWDHLPLLPMTQFPWRFLSVQALFAAAATAALVPTPSPTRDTHHISGITLIVLIAALLTVSVLLPLHPDRLPIGPADVTVERLQLYELFTQNIGTTIRYEWLPRVVVPRPFTSDALIEPDAPCRAVPLDGAALRASLVERGPTHQVWRVWGGGGDMAFPLLYWSGWQARVDGEPVEVWPVEGSGYLALAVPSGEHIVLLRLGHTPVRAAAEVISLVAVAAMLVVVYKSASRQIRKLFIGPLFILTLCVAVLPFSGRDFDADDDLTMDFDQMPYLHHNPGGVDFGGVARLAGYTLSAENLAPGDTLTATLTWSQVNAPYTATLRLVSPAAVRHEELEPLAQTTITPSPNHPVARSHSLSVSLSLPEDIPRGLYLLQLRLFGPGGELRARTPAGKTSGPLYLRPVRVPRGPVLPPQLSVLTAFGPAIRLHAATIAQPAHDRLSVRLAWSAVQPVAANYGISLRLLDAEQRAVVTLDTQPGYGFLPTSLWWPGELVVDRYDLALPENIAPRDGYHLIVILYQVATWEAVGEAWLGDFALPLEAPFEVSRLPRTFSLPPLRHPLWVDFGGEVRLVGYDLEQGEDVLQLTLWWQALKTPRADYTVFVHLFDPATETIVAQNDAGPRGGTYPTSWWAEGEVVSETVTLPLSGVHAGEYRLAVGLYNRTLARLPATAPDGQRLPDDRVILPEETRIAR